MKASHKRKRSRDIRNRIVKLNSSKERRVIYKHKTCHEKTLIHPDSRFKIIWDLIVIMLSVYNSVLIPYDFAYSVKHSILLEIFDRIVDVVFVIDIFINFRTIYRDSKTDDEIRSGK